jgi:hypothetical protein
MNAPRHCHLLAAVFALMFVSASLWLPIEAQSSPKLAFLAMEPVQVLHIDGLELTETFDPGTFERRDYVRGPQEARAREFYRHGRGISVTLSPDHKFLLVDDNYTTKLSKLVIVDLASLKQTDVSSDAVASYRRDTNMGQRNFANARALSLSPIGDKLLVEVRVTYLDASTAEEAAKESALYPPRQYVVDVASGKVRETFVSGFAPEHWY